MCKRHSRLKNIEKSESTLSSMNKNPLTYKQFHNILRHFGVEQSYFLPQMKRSVIICNKLVYTSCFTSCRTT